MAIQVCGRQDEDLGKRTARTSITGLLSRFTELSAFEDHSFRGKIKLKGNSHVPLCGLVKVGNILFKFGFL